MQRNAITDVKRYMRSVLSEYIDRQTGIVDITTLAEDAIDNFDAAAKLGDAEMAYDLSFEVAEEIGANY